ncbi:MAG: tRNA pseudouridine(55) synthase TruB [Deltaproteobacteria bacterium]|nr:tRNA pseudouridine(55) synthase TruB [Deltaproteobacteria bacterium]
MASPYDGILLIDKSRGETSFDVIRKVRKILKVKKVGHAGTLDPFATGLLILLLGQGTKLSPYLMGGRKRYLAVLRLGIETDTLDVTGTIVHTRAVPFFDAGYVESRAGKFMGELLQVPPQYSAVRVMGKRAYELARRGIRVDLAPRSVTVYDLKIVSLSLPEMTLEITCSGGTYIRSLASDLGRELETGAHLKALRREASGSFDVAQALPSEEIGRTLSGGLVEERIIPLVECLPGMAGVQVNDETAERLRKGKRPGWEELGSFPAGTTFPGEAVKVLNRGELVALLEAPAKKAKKGEQVRIARIFR